jgi:hypothetical protein
MFGTGGNIIINKNMPIIIKTVKCTCFWLMLTIGNGKSPKRAFSISF